MHLNRTLRHIKADFLHLRNIEAYAAAAVAAVLAPLAIIGDLVPVNVQWAALLAGVAVIVYRSAVPLGSPSQFDELAGDRDSFHGLPLRERWHNAREVWIFAPSAVNLLNSQHCDILRREVLSHADSVVRVIVLDPTNPAAIELAAHQLDDSLDYPMQEFAESLRTSVRQLGLMSKWQVAGSFEYGFIDYNPGFSLVVTDASRRSASLVVEFHAFHNETTHSRMHLELTPNTSERWFPYWVSQFDHIWERARKPETADSPFAEGMRDQSSDSTTGGD
ncbi:hypothetical protein GCM10023321_25790 [Pseudonocardia eucalypti]|uniref:Uncharacterized protein n=1 Tax=Pseudonocardia eucalypti TaxID=648755 RepID=A0ABP9PZ44_9PSEU